ncbi:hypothetical protein BD410DRAFT_258622 [Rickenella mellea]|uniref:Uncharacterized protein n=1 Tax=Rickenella mellea TaxID=50990 RepID=A0A4Y7Q460_9AGAM|nr:hypothetical protein BD410DRAFT_258622 [Rickenella mellea]
MSESTNARGRWPYGFKDGEIGWAMGDNYKWRKVKVVGTAYFDHASPWDTQKPRLLQVHSAPPLDPYHNRRHTCEATNMLAHKRDWRNARVIDSKFVGQTKAQYIFYTTTWTTEGGITSFAPFSPQLGQLRKDTPSIRRMIQMSNSESVARGSGGIPALPQKLASITKDITRYSLKRKTWVNSQYM